MLIFYYINNLMENNTYNIIIKLLLLIEFVKTFVEATKINFKDKHFIMSSTSKL